MILDTFLFNGEEQMLNFRLHEYDQYVDKFVIIECTTDFLNRKKELFWPKIAHKFSKFAHKIEYSVVTSPFQESAKFGYFKSVELQSIIRNVGVKQVMQKGDIIFHSDIDEFWNPTSFDITLRLIKKGYAVKWSGDWYVWDLEHKIMESLPFHAFAISYDMAKEININNLRTSRPKRKFGIHYRKMGGPYRGWHLTWFGGIDQVIQKAKYGMGSDLYRTKALKGSSRISEIKDRYGKKRAPIMCRKIAHTEIEYIPITENNNLPVNYKLL